MANLLRNAMVYIGLADEDEAYEEAAELPAASGASRAAQPAAEFADGEPLRAAPVTPITRAPKPAPIPAAGAMNEILTVHPKAYNQDAQVIAENFRNGIPVIMNLSQMEDGDARRLIDFASGLTQGLYGRIERVTSRVFLLTPENIDVHGETREPEGDSEHSFFA